MRHQKIPSLIIMSLVFFLALGARAEEQANPLGFKAWKEQQILFAQNRLLRVTAEMDIAKNSGKTPDGEPEGKTTPKQKALKRFHKAQEKSSIERLNNDMGLAKNAVQTASELTMDDYVTVYLPSVAQNPKALEALVESSSHQELSHILMEILKKQSDQRDKASLSSPKFTEFWANQAPSSP